MRSDVEKGEAERERLRRQSAALARFGGHALRSRDLDSLLHQACEMISEIIGVELVKVLELLPDGDTMVVRQGINWREGIVGHETFPAHSGSPSGYALDRDEPVISRDMEEEERFGIPDMMVEHDVRSMVNVVIRAERPWGVLEVDAREKRDFNEDDVAFLQNCANLLAAAIDRLDREAELRKAVDRGEILLGELQHRVRNILMNIQALAERTRRGSRNLEEFSEAFASRLAALARTQDLLTRSVTEMVPLSDALLQELLAHGAEEGDRLWAAGPEVRLPPKVAQALRMGFHELATNSVKYGALSGDKARLEVTWMVVPADEGTDIVIRWRESGVSINGQPERRGFGTETIEDALPHLLGGEARQIFHRDGLECIIRFPKPDDDEGPQLRDGEP